MSAQDGAPASELKNGSYECFILALSILSVANIVVAALVPLPETRNVILVIDLVLSFIFLGDFAFRLFSAPTKRSYFVHQRGWLDLLGSLPIPSVRVFRLFRVARVGQLLREVGLARLLEAISRDRAGSALLVVVFLAILLLEVGSAAILAIEIRAPEGNIKDASDAIWYTYVTVTTVGYGDRYPVTNPGRVIGVLTMTVGVGLFGTLTGFLANAFVTPAKGGEGATGSDGGAGEAELRVEVAEIRRRLDALLELQQRSGTGLPPSDPKAWPGGGPQAPGEAVGRPQRESA
jgi:voltage-gated potassium channel